MTWWLQFLIKFHNQTFHSENQTSALSLTAAPKQRIMVQAKTWILTKHFDGFPTDSNFELKVEELPEPKDGGRMIFVSLFSLKKLPFFIRVKH